MAFLGRRSQEPAKDRAKPLGANDSIIGSTSKDPLGKRLSISSNGVIKSENHSVLPFRLGASDTTVDINQTAKFNSGPNNTFSREGTRKSSITSNYDDTNRLHIHKVVVERLLDKISEFWNKKAKQELRGPFFRLVIYYRQAKSKIARVISFSSEEDCSHVNFKQRLRIRSLANWCICASHNGKKQF